MTRSLHWLLALALVGCVMDNPAFDGLGAVGVGESSDTSAGESNSSVGDGDPGGDGDGDLGGDGDGDFGGDGDGDSGDGDGDGDTSPLCGAPVAYADCDLLAAQELTDDPFRALGLGCEGPDDATIGLSSETFEALDPDSWRVASHFGLAPGPNFGGWRWAARESQVVSSGDDLPDIQPNTSGAILVLTTGQLPPLDEEGGLVFSAGSQASLGNNLNQGSSTFPEPISPALGSNGGEGGTPFENCDGSNDCSDSLYTQWYEQGWNSLHDRLWLRFELEVPAGVTGYMFDFAFFSSEYPAFVGTQYNDMFVAWSSSPSYTGNLTFIDQTPMNATSLAEVEGFHHTLDDPALFGTGFEGHGATGWLIARGPATPGENLEITLYVSDLGDPQNGSVVLLDNFRWDCGGCVGLDCGFEP